MKTLVLGAGKYQRVEGAEHQDQFPFDGIDHVFDLNKDWVIDGFAPLPKNTYDRILAIHVVEHLKSLIHFMDNCHDILPEGGTLTIETPNAGVNPDLEFCDPTHIRLYRPYTFHNYFTPEGIAKFGYTNKAWEFILVETFQMEVQDDCIRVIATPIK